MAERQSIFHDAVKSQTQFDRAYRRVWDDEEREQEERLEEPHSEGVGIGLSRGLAPFGNWGRPAKLPATDELRDVVEEQAIEAYSIPMLWGFAPRQMDPAILKQRVKRALRNHMARLRTSVGKPAGRVKYFVNVLKAWGFSRSDAARMLGVPGGYIGELFLDGRAPISPGDMSERLVIVVSLAVALDNLYDDDAVVRTWLDQRRTELGGKTPRELLAGGTLDGLFKVGQLVRYEANR